MINLITKNSCSPKQDLPMQLELLLGCIEFYARRKAQNKVSVDIGIFDQKYPTSTSTSQFPKACEVCWQLVAQNRLKSHDKITFESDWNQINECKTTSQLPYMCFNFVDGVERRSLSMFPT